MKKILVIDDLPENVFMLQDRLMQEGYEVFTAYGGNDGLEKAYSAKPDLILLDVMMPDLSGFDVCKSLINDDRTKHIPIILVTAKSGPEDIKEGLEAGAFDYIKKPFNRVELMARVKSALKLSDANRQLLEIEKQTTYLATIVTANHKIKQPLTLLSLTSAAIKKELEKEEFTREAILNRVKYIDAAIKDISEVLNKLNSITKPVLSEYAKDVKMINIESKSTQS
jgi:two-component system cell cycle response regulator